MRHLRSGTRWPCVVLLTLSAVASAGFCSQVARSQFQTVAEKSDSSIVLIRGFCARQESSHAAPCSLNTGFFVSSEGQVVTSIYALAGCSRAELVTVDGKKAEARLVGLDQASGLALLQTPLTETVPLVHAETPPAVGEWIVGGFARPAGEDGAVIVYGAGMLCSNRGSLKLLGVQWQNLLVGKLLVEPGGASAPLLNLEGRLVGVLLAVDRDRSRGGNCYGIGYQELERIVAGLKSGSRHLGWLGVALEDADGKEGARVRAVLEGSPAHAAGIRPNDLLLAIDDQPIIHPVVLRQKVLGSAPGVQLQVKLLRREQLKTMQVKLGMRPILISRGDRHTLSQAGQPWMPGLGQVPGETWRFLQTIRELQKRNAVLRMRLNELEQRIQRMERERTRRGRATSSPLESGQPSQ